MKNKRLVVICSNGFRCEGCMSVDFVKQHIGAMYPDQEIAISVIEVSEKDCSITPVCERKQGVWNIVE